MIYFLLVLFALFRQAAHSSWTFYDPDREISAIWLLNLAAWSFPQNDFIWTLHFHITTGDSISEKSWSLPNIYQETRKKRKRAFLKQYFILLF